MKATDFLTTLTSVEGLLESVSAIQAPNQRAMVRGLLAGSAGTAEKEEPQNLYSVILREAIKLLDKGTAPNQLVPALRQHYQVAPR